MSGVDLEFRYHGTVSIIAVLSQRGAEWVKENVEAEEWQLENSTIAVEPRMLQDILTQARTDGLICEAL